MNIKLRAKNLIKKYNTTNPFDLSSYLNIEVIFTPMRRTRGFCDCILKRKFIVINNNLPYHEQIEVCAHELGHIKLHNGLGHYFLTQHTLFSIGKYERQANEFAWHLLFNEKQCIEDYDGDIEKFAIDNGIYDLYKSPKFSEKR